MEEAPVGEFEGFLVIALQNNWEEICSTVNVRMERVKISSRIF